MASIPQASRQPLSIHLATTGGAQPGVIPRIAHGLAVVLLLAALVLLPAGCNRQPTGSTVQQPLAPTPPAGRLQEVAPPAAVQQLQSALADRDPRVAIETPADGATLPAGEWTLRVKVNDWPLVDAGSLGLGAHLAIQIDDQPVLRLTEHRVTPAGDLVETQLPALLPGSHRITVYAARPWGEAVKNPGASARLRVQSVAGNPLAVPAPGTPELVAVSPAEWSSAEPVLLDWLLYDAPLQHLRDGDGSWRLRVSVNGDAFLVDQNVPLWLRGWKNGSNALQLELVDGVGEPMNPPFNSLVREVRLGGGEKPHWLTGPLKPEELAVLLGETPPPPAEPAQREPASAVIPAPIQEELPSPETEPTAAATPPAPTGEPTINQEEEEEEEEKDDALSAPVPAPPEPTPTVGEEAPVPTAPENNDEGQPTPAEPAETSAQPEPETAPAPPMSAAEPATPSAPITIANPDRIAPSSSLNGSARDQVAEDGTLIQPAPRGPLAGLRQRLRGS